MKKILLTCFVIVICFSASIYAQIPINTLVQISKAEDELRYDASLEDLMKSANPKIRIRAALAAGRIGDDAAIPALTILLEKESLAEVRKTAAFALGEIESIKAANAILKVLKNTENSNSVRARATEAAGKIAAANAKDAKAKELGEAILDALDFEDKRGKGQSKEVVLLGITAALRAKPAETDFVVAKFLTNLDARIRADAANTLSRIRAKNANEKLRAMLLSDDDPIARANAARALGAAEDKDSFDLLLEAAVSDEDSRVRVNAIRSVGSLKDAKAADKLLERGGKLLADYKKSKFVNPVEKNELLEIAATLGRILPNSNSEKATDFLIKLDKAEKYKSAEVEIALARVSPKRFQQLQREKPFNLIKDWQTLSVSAQGLNELANLEETVENKEIKKEIAEKLRSILVNGLDSKNSKEFIQPEKFPAIPDALRGYAAFKTDDLAKILREYLVHKDVFVRAAAAELLGDLSPGKDNFEVLKYAFYGKFEDDNKYNDAQLAILDALAKQDKEQAKELLLAATDSFDVLVRRKAVGLLTNLGVEKDAGGKLLKEKVTPLMAYNIKAGTKLGQVLNTEADYRRAVSRKNGIVKAVLTTEKGTFTIDLLPEDAPLTVDNFIKLARSNYFNGVAVHRVVPNFVMQDGDPRGDGNGGPGWEIRCEINMIPYERGAVGMALSGKDTGGSQWFVTHSPQPHLDGGYTIFGKVNETDMKIVDNLVRGDKILSVKIVEGNTPQKSAKGRKN